MKRKRIPEYGSNKRVFVMSNHLEMAQRIAEYANSRLSGPGWKESNVLTIALMNGIEEMASRYGMTSDEIREITRRHDDAFKEKSEARLAESSRQAEAAMRVIP